MTSRNRRKHPRVHARNVAAHLRTAHGRAPCTVENISSGGVFVRTDRLEQVGTELFVDLVKPGWKKQLTLEARVTSCVDALDGRLSKRMPGMGIQFVRLDEQQHERLRSLLRELGAPDELAEITLSAEEEATEMDLRALELVEAPDASTEVLDPQPMPLWQQVQMVERENASAPVHLVERDIASALEDADFSPPAPLVMEQRPHRTAPPRVELPPPAPRKPPEADNTQRLMLQIRGLIMELSDAQQALAQKDAELMRLRDELQTVRAALARTVKTRQG